ncbi:MAG TPA: hypothetical protein VFC18_16145 [Burkholderiales bacterium]|nr:hypothetical protein [Burkholderiales bacterium]
MIRNRLLVLLFALLSFGAGAQSESQLVEKYATLAGSDADAQTLVTGLRTGNDFSIGTTSFDPPTGEMGYGNVNISLALAEKSLADQGITSPTSEQLHAALIGTASDPGVLAQRAAGMGWGQLALSRGYTLGEVMRSPRADKALEKAPSIEKAVKVAKPERPMKPERPVRFERPERPVKPERPIR